MFPSASSYPYKKGCDDLTLSVLWVVCLVASVLYSCHAGTAHLLTAAFTEGLIAAADFCLSAGVMMVFWCGLFAVMEHAGLAAALSKLLRPVLRPLFPITAAHESVFSALTANVSANLLGLGNAATPMGIRAAQGIAKLPKASRELACLVVMNTASIQLLPTTVASVRASLGCVAPLDILPCVLVSSVCSVAAGLCAVRLLYRL